MKYARFQVSHSKTYWNGFGLDWIGWGRRRPARRIILGGAQ